MTAPNRAFALLLCGVFAALGCGGRRLGGDAGDAGASDGDAPVAIDLAGEAPVDSSEDVLRPIDGRCPAWSSRATDAGTCACTEGLTDVCPAPCVDTPSGRQCIYSGFPLLCVDTRNDPDNCGGCATACASTAICREGACGPTPTRVLGPFPDCTELSMAVSGGVLYWADTAHGVVGAVQTAGGTQVIVARDQLEPTWLRVYGDSIYWIARGAKTLMRAPSAGGPPTIVVASPNAGSPPEMLPGINGYAVLPDGTVYISSGAQIHEVAAGAAPRLVVEEIEVPGDLPMGLGVGSGAVAYTQLSGHISATMLPPRGAPAVKCGITVDDAGVHNPCRLIFTHGVPSDELYVRDGRVYYASRVSGGIFALNFLMGSVDPERIGTSFGGDLFALSLEGDQAFFLADEYVVQASLVAGPGTALVRAQPFAPTHSDFVGGSSIAADATHVYWTVVEVAPGPPTCSVFRVARR